MVGIIKSLGSRKQLSRASPRFGAVQRFVAVVTGHKLAEELLYPLDKLLRPTIQSALSEIHYLLCLSLSDFRSGLSGPAQ